MLQYFHDIVSNDKDTWDLSIDRESRIMVKLI